jgi:hypothetical protein
MSKNEKFNLRFVCSDSTCFERKIIVRHIESGLEITSPQFNNQEKSDQQLKKELWEIMKRAIEIFNL